MDFQFIDTWLELPELRVIGQVLRPRELQLHLERRASDLICLHCQGCCSRSQEGRERCLRDLPMLDRPVTLRLPIRRFDCADCHHQPWETSETFGDRVKWTERLDHRVRQEFLHGCPCQELARRYDLSARTGCRWTFEKSRGARPRQLGRVLGIDTYSSRKGHRYNMMVVDLEQGRPITTLKGRRVDDVAKWFKSRPQQELDQVEGVVLEMSKSFYAAIQEGLGDQVQVIDRFPIVKQAVDALDRVLRSVQHQLDSEEAKGLKTLRKRWLKSPNQLDIDELIARADWRRRFPE